MPTGERIRSYRDRLGLSQIELASRLRPWLGDVKDYTISRIENGVREVTARELPYFAHVLNCSPNDLVDWPVAPKKSSLE